MKVWILTGRFQNGGLERVLANLAKYLNTQPGIDITLVTRKLDYPANLFTTLPIRTLELPDNSLWGFLTGVLRNLKQHRPTHVITCANDISCLLVALKLLFFPQMAVIITQHLTVSPEIASARDLRRLKLRAVRVAMRLLYPQADAIVAVSHGVAEDLSRQVGLDLSAISVIYNPIIDDESTEVVLDIDPQFILRTHEGTPIIVFAGRLEPVKRLDILLEAFALVRRQRTARLLILGDGSLLPALKQQAHDLEVSGDVHFFGHHQQITGLLTQSTVLVLPSDYEGFGNVLVEAMACGIQVIATDCPSGPAEILENGRYGQLIPTGSPAALSIALIKTLNAEVHIPAEELKTRARHFTISRAGKAYLDILKGNGN